MYLFRNLKKDEVEVRRGRNVGTSKVELLLYKNARVDQNLLDEKYGSRWARDVKVLNGVVYAGIGIYDPELNTVFWRWDCGSESNFEKEKSESSDAFKRAGFNWGIGRELYSSPRIIVTPKNDYTQFFVDEIGYDSKDRINNLRIVDDNGTVVFNMVDGKKIPYREPEVDRKELLRIVCGDLKKDAENDRDELLRFYNYYIKKTDSFTNFTEAIVRSLWNKWNR